MPNSLAAETSPYLLQHRDNPVDWLPWGDEAFRRARMQDKPIFLSVGYAACHWCHVMERESFENDAIAAYLNEHFVSVKVDREERPDVDSIYMDATQAMTGRGGWPMSVFLTPDGRPFYAGTYYPPTDRPGMPGFLSVLRAVRDAWHERREGVLEQSARITAAIRRTHARDAGPVPETLLDDALAEIRSRWDDVNGGFAGGPKFPPTMVVEFLLREAVRRGGDPSGELQMADLALRKMAQRGLYDHLGGGFHRYCVDATWAVPHFEKMLYDNALLVPAYLHAFQMTGDTGHRDVACATLDYLLREMRQPEGGFSSSQDADSEGVEGKFFVWAPRDLVEALGAELASPAARYFGVTAEGNFEHTGASVLHVADPSALTHDELDGVKRSLLAARADRVPPATDDKVLASWNGLALSAFAEAARVLDRADYHEAAVALAEFLLEHMLADGLVHHSWRRGTLRPEAFAADQAAVGCGLLDLYETDFDPRWFVAARRLGDVLLSRFGGHDGGFFDTAEDGAALVVRPRDLMDNAVPSANSLAADLLARLGSYTGEARYSEAAAAAARAGGTLLVHGAAMFGRALSVCSQLAAEVVEVAVVGSDPDPYLGVLRSEFRPFAVVAAGPGTDADPAVPLLAERSAVDGHTAAYVCRGFVCEAPVTEPEALSAALASR